MKSHFFTSGNVLPEIKTQSEEYTDTLTLVFNKQLIERGFNVYCDSVGLFEGEIKLLDFLQTYKLPLKDNNPDGELQTLSYKHDKYVVISNDDVLIAAYGGYGEADKVNCIISGTKELVEKVKSDILEKYALYSSKPYIEWYYDDDKYETVTVDDTNIPIDEMYPFLGDMKLSEYYDKYKNSKANILVLQGPPGTGKTSFIRGLLIHLKFNAVLSYDTKIIQNDGIFSSFISDNDLNCMIFEDADTFLNSRENGNTSMHRFLNVGDGLVSRPNKKIIFTTNLNSVKDIDPALIRPGRCFDVLEFASLTSEEAKNVAKKMNIEYASESSSDITLAEVFNAQQFHISKPKSKIGFI
jgi:hypothetical protein